MNKKAILLSTILLNPSNTVFADIYKWTDEQGVIHFSDTPIKLPENSQIIEETQKPAHPKVQINQPSTNSHVQQIPEKTKEQHEKELAKLKEESKKAIDGMFSFANEGLISIRNGIITIGVTMLSIEFLILYIKKKRKNHD